MSKSKPKLPGAEIERRQTPLHIAEIPLIEGGVIGITLAPGKYDPARGHARDIDKDLDVIAKWGACAVVTLVEDFELEMLDIRDFGILTRLRGMDWHHNPIVDVSTPDAEFMRRWPMLSMRLRDHLGRGRRVLVHCRGGLGRAGMIAARLLVERGNRPGDAIRYVRRVRPGAIETRAQREWVERFPYA